MDEGCVEGPARSWRSWDWEQIEIGGRGDGAVGKEELRISCECGFVNGQILNSKACLIELIQCVLGVDEDIEESFLSNIGVLGFDSYWKKECASEGAEGLCARFFGVYGDLAASERELASGRESDHACSQNRDRGICFAALVEEVCCSDRGSHGEGDATATVAVVVDEGFGAELFGFEAESTVSAGADACDDPEDAFIAEIGGFKLR